MKLTISISLLLLMMSHNGFETEFKSKVQTIDKKYSSELQRIFYYSGVNTSNSQYLVICKKCNITINSIKNIISNRYVKPNFNNIPITIELWVFENEKDAKRFHSDIIINSPLTKCALLKIDYSYILRGNVIVYISGNPKQQELLKRLYNELNEL